MKNLFILLLIISSKLKAQISDSVFYYIKSCKINKIEFNDYYLRNGQYLNFNWNDSKEIIFYNSAADRNEYSFGKVTELQTKKGIEKKCNVEWITFCWQFRNSYDNDSGYATVKLKRTHLIYGVEFSAKIIPDRSKEIIEFYGYTNEIKSEYNIDENDIDSICLEYTEK